MENASLTSAHTHARNAGVESLKSNTAAASEEHEQAAGEFARAAQGTTDIEALRILKLLEEHHRRLALIVKSSPKQVSQSPTENALIHENGTSAEGALHTVSAPVTRSSSPTPTTPGQLAKAPTRRNPPRDLSSSIASNLATARGIPGAQQRRGTPASPTVTAHNAAARLNNRAERQPAQDARRDRTAKAAETAGHVLTQATSDKAQTAQELESGNEKPPPSSPPTEEPFNRFFSTFENLFSKLSAPLAFTGLPLAGEETSPSDPSSSKVKPKPPKEPTTTRASNEPDVTKIFSKATLRAIKEDHGRHAFGGVESFYVVPPSGGTVSYAGILSHNRGDGHNLPDVIEEELDEKDGEDGDSDAFEDAQEMPAPPSPRSVRSAASSRRGASSVNRPSRIGRKTMEELELENETLRQLVDKQSKRLAMWEATSQSQSMALAQSFRIRGPRPSSPIPALPDDAAVKIAQAAQGPATRAAEDRIKELEQQIVAEREEREILEKQNEKLKKDNDKLAAVVGRYREKWEVLKAGARRKVAERNSGTGRLETVEEGKEQGSVEEGQ